MNIDCGSYSKAGVDEAGALDCCLPRAPRRDVSRSIRNETLGDTVVGTFGGRPDGARLLLIGHLDTVFPDGTAAARPFAIRDGIATGPGRHGHEGGPADRAVRRSPRCVDAGWRAAVLAPGTSSPTRDEELGSPVSAPLIRSLAPDADASLVLECARANGDIVSARKGILDLRLHRDRPRGARRRRA